MHVVTHTNGVNKKKKRVKRMAAWNTFTTVHTFTNYKPSFYTSCNILLCAIQTSNLTWPVFPYKVLKICRLIELIWKVCCCVCLYGINETEKNMKTKRIKTMVEKREESVKEDILWFHFKKEMRIISISLDIYI